jgi:hypothetical protein
MLYSHWLTDCYITGSGQDSNSWLWAPRDPYPYFTVWRLTDPSPLLVYSAFQITSSYITAKQYMASRPTRARINFSSLLRQCKTEMTILSRRLFLSSNISHSYAQERFATSSSRNHCPPFICSNMSADSTGRFGSTRSIDISIHRGKVQNKVYPEASWPSETFVGKRFLFLLLLFIVLEV